MRRPIGVEPGLANRHVQARLRRLRHVGEERECRVLDDWLGCGVDRAGPTAESGEWRVVHAVRRVGAQSGVAVGQLVGRAVEDPLRARQDDRADLVLNRRLRLVDGKRADVAPVQRQGAAAGHEQAA